MMDSLTDTDLFHFFVKNIMNAVFSVKTNNYHFKQKKSRMGCQILVLEGCYLTGFRRFSASNPHDLNEWATTGFCKKQGN